MSDVYISPAETVALKSILANVVVVLATMSEPLPPNVFLQALRRDAVNSIAANDFADDDIKLEAFRSVIIDFINHFFNGLHV